MARNTSQFESPRALKAFIEKALESDKAEDITTIELDEGTALADYMIIASGTSNRHLTALAEKLNDRLSENKIGNIHIEGLQRGDWVVMDIGDVIVHLFRPEVRFFYNIEKMWQVTDQASEAAHTLSGGKQHLHTIT